jgi:phage shock protein PspC (stress-responsive transcriptional regulator)
MSEKTCPWCAERVAEGARKCPHCASSVEGGLRDPRSWHRDYPERKLAGVACAVAENLCISVSLVRAGFVLLAFFHGFGILVYAALWFVIPREPGAGSGFDRVVDAARTLFGESPRARSAPRRKAGPGSDEDGASDGWNPTRS